MAYPVWCDSNLKMLESHCLTLYGVQFVVSHLSGIEVDPNIYELFLSTIFDKEPSCSCSCQDQTQVQTHTLRGIYMPLSYVTVTMVHVLPLGQNKVFSQLLLDIQEEQSQYN